MKSHLLVAASVLLASANPVKKRDTATQVEIPAGDTIPVMVEEKSINISLAAEMSSQMTEASDETQVVKLRKTTKNLVLVPETNGKWEEPLDLPPESQQQPEQQTKKKQQQPQPTKQPTKQKQQPPQRKPADPLSTPDQSKTNPNSVYYPPHNDDDSEESPVKEPHNEAPVEDSYAYSFVNLHNEKRGTRGAQNLTWSSSLAQQARGDCRCDFQHHTNGYGQNIWMGKGSVYTTKSSPRDATVSWYKENSLYNYNSPVFNSQTGHFTQMVWKSTRQLGCATVKCGEGQYSGWTYTVCNYKPAGNAMGEFEKNVLPVNSPVAEK